MPTTDDPQSHADDVIAAVALAIWIYLLAAAAASGCAASATTAFRAPRVAAVTAVIPARNEAECIAESIGSLARQDYPGAFSIVLVDDDSDDGTADVARARGERLVSRSRRST